MQLDDNFLMLRTPGYIDAVAGRTALMLYFDDPGFMWPTYADAEGVERCSQFFAVRPKPAMWPSVL